MKKSLFVLLSLVLIASFTLAACGGAAPAAEESVGEQPAAEEPVEEAPAEDLAEDGPVEENPTAELTELVFEPFELTCQLPPSNPFKYGSEGIHFVKAFDGDKETAFWKVFFELDDSKDADVYPWDVSGTSKEFLVDGTLVAEINSHMEVIIWECPDNGYYSSVVTFTDGESDVVAPPGYESDTLNVSWNADAQVFEVSFTDFTQTTFRWTFTDYTQEANPFWSIHLFAGNTIVDDIEIYEGQHYTFMTTHPQLLANYKLLDFFWGTTTVTEYERLEVTVSAE